MKQCMETFRRYEKKYLISESQFRKLLDLLGGTMRPDRYGESTICSIYFDTPDRLLIRRSLEKPVYKEKLRLRSYGVPGPHSRVFVELKKKYRGVVYKRREAMCLCEATDYLYRGLPAPQPSQVTREIDWFRAFYDKLGPAMLISYDRIALYGEENPQLRITFDSEIRYREQELFLDEGAWGTPLLQPRTRLMEIKAPGAMPVWLCHLLDSLMIYPASFSKYGTAYLDAMQKGTKKEVSICA